MNTMQWRRVAWGLGALYLMLAAAGAWTAFPYKLSGRFKQVVYAVMDLTGTDNDFGFFAPAVSSQVQVDVLLRDSRGQTERYDFWSANKEIGFRLNSLITSSMRRPLLRDVCARSWAASLLGSRPTAQQVTVIAYVHDLPPMDKFRAGQPVRWQPFYEGTFARMATPTPPALP